MIRQMFLEAAPAEWAQRLHFAWKQPSRRRTARLIGDPGWDAILASIGRQGFVVIPGLLCAQACAAAIQELEQAFRAYPRYTHRYEDDRMYGLEATSSVARELLDKPIWVEIAEAYSGEASIGLFVLGNRLRANGQAHGSGGGWHRDCFARELKLLIYLNDVADENGPFQIIERSHRSSDILGDMKSAGLAALQNRLRSTEVAKLAPARVRTISAPAGTGILFDSSTIHRGAPILSGTRYAFTLYLAARRRATEAHRAHYAPILS